ncbi:hypothetical protein EDD17DRAFT_1506838 [Pisolithus thermaeus]|nr:hypothetical protein EDD17DRAFT_1506838 [Pisolithus thermaeus]
MLLSHSHLGTSINDEGQPTELWHIQTYPVDTQLEYMFMVICKVRTEIVMERAMMWIDMLAVLEARDTCESFESLGGWVCEDPGGDATWFGVWLLLPPSRSAGGGLLRRCVSKQSPFTNKHVPGSFSWVPCSATAMMHNPEVRSNVFPRISRAWGKQDGAYRLGHVHATGKYGLGVTCGFDIDAIKADPGQLAIQPLAGTLSLTNDESAKDCGMNREPRLSDMQGKPQGMKPWVVEPASHICAILGGQHTTAMGVHTHKSMGHCIKIVKTLDNDGRHLASLR